MDDYTILAMIARLVNFETWRREIGALSMTPEVVDKHPLDRDLALEVLEELGLDECDRRLDRCPFAVVTWRPLVALCRLEISVVTCTCGAEVAEYRPHPDDRKILTQGREEGLEVTVPELGLSAFLCADCISKLSKFF